MAIEVDTEVERICLDQLADELGLPRQVNSRIHELIGLQPA